MKTTNGLVWGVLIALVGQTIAIAQQRAPRRQQELPVELPESSVTINEEGSFRVIIANGIPDHDHAEFPRRGNPHAIRPQRYHYKVPLNPEIADKITVLERQPFGVALNGVPFDPGTAEYWEQDINSGWRYEALSGKINLGIDENLAHVQPTGAYHYHGMPKGLIENYSKEPAMVMVGYAADGFPMYSQYGYKDPQNPKSGFVEMKSSFRVKEGDRPGGPGGAYDGVFVEDYVYEKGLGDLDECNGRFGVTPEYPEGIYHYYITTSYPFIPRAFKGTPHESFERRGGGGGLEPGRRGGGDRRRPGGGGGAGRGRAPRADAEVPHGHAH